MQNEMVRANIAVVIKAMQHHRVRREEREKSLSLIMHRETGMFQLPSQVLQTDYLPIVLHLDLDLREVSVTEKESNFEGISKTARQVLSETCAEIKQTFSSIHDLRELSYLKIPASTERGVLHEAWFAVDREGAEKLLLVSPPGTYLFRKDHFAGCLEELLVAAKKERLKCLTLSYVDSTGQVHDKTVIHWKDRWMFYDDDPTLSGDSYASLDALLLSLGPMIRMPLLHHKVYRSA